MTSSGAAIFRSAEKNQPPDWEIFCFAYLVFVVLQLAWAVQIDKELGESLRRAVSSARPLIYWQDVFRRSFILSFGLGVLGFLPLAALFSDHKRIRPRLAWMAFAAWGLLITAANLWSASAPFGGYADASGVTWLDRNGVVGRRSWSTATVVVAGCRHQKGLSKLRYDVRFDRRSARLGREFSGPNMVQWLAAIDQINGAMPANVRFTRTAFNLKCVIEYARPLDLSGDRALVSLLRPTLGDAKRIGGESPVWGAFIAEVAADR